ncbi:MAG: phosphohydrolase, partial [Schleiferiaceae bacterium]|nr:phosphohydrolase [Schleiferiaceae bacterium]
SRSLMYWQVYMHKAVLCAENMLVKLLSRAHEIAQIDETMFGGKELLFFLTNRPSKKEFESNPNILNLFTQLDDSDILAAMKQWRNHKDFILSDLSSRLLDRKLFQIKFLPEKINSDKRNYLEKSISDSMGITLIDSRYFILEGTASNSTYVSNKEEIKILNKEGNVIPLSAASEILPLSVYSHTLTRPFVCWPKEIKWTD